MPAGEDFENDSGMVQSLQDWCDTWIAPGEQLVDRSDLVFSKLGSVHKYAPLHTLVPCTALCRRYASLGYTLSPWRALATHPSAQPCRAGTASVR